MKISIDIPDRYAKGNIHVFSGMNYVARRLQPAMVWEVKAADCSRCGLCCLAINEAHPLGTPEGCRHIERSPGEQLCGMGIFRPHGCAIAGGDQVGIETCSIKWERAE